MFTTPGPIVVFQPCEALAGVQRCAPPSVCVCYVVYIAVLCLCIVLIRCCTRHCAVVVCRGAPPSCSSRFSGCFAPRRTSAPCLAKLGRAEIEPPEDLGGEIVGGDMGCRHTCAILHEAKWGRGGTGRGRGKGGCRVKKLDGRGCCVKKLGGRGCRVTKLDGRGCRVKKLSKRDRKGCHAKKLYRRLTDIELELLRAPGCETVDTTGSVVIHPLCSFAPESLLLLLCI